MKDWLVDVLRCPKTGGKLFLKSVAETQDDEVVTGVLASRDAPGHEYPVVRGVPDLTISSRGIEKEQSLTSFGQEWRSFDNWGWLDQLPDEPDAQWRYFGGLLENSHNAFRNKTLARPEDCGEGALVLDAGCGNGRFSYQAQSRGAKVVAMDASEAAYVAFENCRNRGVDSVGVVRGDALNMPFADDTFKYAFSIGVMQHTGEAEVFLGELSRVTAPGAAFSVNCYGRGLPSYEFIDAAIRMATTRLSRPRVLAIARGLAATDRFLRTGGRLRERFRRWLYQHINLLPTTIHMYDWYAPKLAEHYTPEQLNAWLAALQVEVLSAQPPFHEPGYDDRARRRQHAAFQFLARNPVAPEELGEHG